MILPVVAVEHHDPHQNCIELLQDSLLGILIFFGSLVSVLEGPGALESYN